MRLRLGTWELIFPKNRNISAFYWKRSAIIQIIGDLRARKHILLLLFGGKSHYYLDVSRYLAARSRGVSTIIKLYIINFFFCLEVLGFADAGWQGWATLVERFCLEMIRWTAVVAYPDWRPCYSLYLDYWPQHLILIASNIVVLYNLIYGMNWWNIWISYLRRISLKLRLFIVLMLLEVILHHLFFHLIVLEFITLKQLSS